jgi:putative redox protein
MSADALHHAFFNLPHAPLTAIKRPADRGVAMEVKVSWQDGMAFRVDQDGHSFTIDAMAEHGGRDLGPQPKGLMLAALAGCTAMDVASILGRMRVQIERFEVSVKGELTEEHPKKFISATTTYRLWGEQLPDKLKKVRRAVQLSEENYCGVSATLAPAVELKSEIFVNDQAVEKNPPGEW